MATRRKADVKINNSSQVGEVSADMVSSSSSMRWASSRPTRLEFLLLAIYPATLFLGSVFSTVSPTSRNVPYSPVSQSHPLQFAPSYFAQKKNIFNVYFVKIGWFWTTLAFFAFWTFHSGFGVGLSQRRCRALARYTLMTLWWISVTQWFFGPPLIDIIFRFTGGQCDLSKPEFRGDKIRDTENLLTAAACKAVGGSWNGGHDISGHVFLLILGSSLLWLEFLPALTRVEGLRDGRLITLKNGKIASVAAEKDSVQTESDVTAPSVRFALLVAGLMWWMLLMTAAYFHTWFEKLTGLLVAFIGLWTVYFLPRTAPQIRMFLGMPGV